MENIIFCGGCGTFISAAEISAGKASKINNIYYCQKCSTGTKSAPARPASAQGSKVIPPRPAGPAQAVPARPATGPVPIKRPAQQPPVQAPSQARPAAPGPRPQPPAQAQRPAAPKPVAPARQLDETVPIAQPARPSPAKTVARPVQMQKTQKVMSPAPPRTSQTSRIRPVPAQINTAEEGLEELDAVPTGRFGKAKASKGGIKKIYLIGGAAAVAIIVIIAVFVHLSNKAEEKKKDNLLQAQKQAYKAIEEAEKDYADEPQKILDEIKKQGDKLKGTDYEKRVAEKQENAKALIEIKEKVKDLEKPVDTAEEVDKRIKDITALKNNPAINKNLDEKLRGMLNQFKKQQREMAQKEKQEKEQQEAAEKKAYEDFKVKIEKLRGQKDWKGMMRECDILLGRPNGLQYQEEADKIKEEAKSALEEDQEKARRRKEWQVLNDDISKWDRSGDSKAEIYVDDDKILLKNTASASNRGAIASISNNNEGEGWKDFTMTLEFKVVKGSFEMFLRGGYQAFNIPGIGTFNVFSGIPIPFPRKFKDEWQRYTIELKGKKLTISGSGLSEPKVSDVPEGKGGIGINIKGGDEIIVKELKVKVIE